MTAPTLKLVMPNVAGSALLIVAASVLQDVRLVVFARTLETRSIKKLMSVGKKYKFKRIMKMTTKSLKFADGFHEVECLLYYDGPLVSHYRDSNGADYIVAWTDLGEEYDYWYAIEVPTPALAQFGRNQLSLRQLMEQAPRMYECKTRFGVDDIHNSPVGTVYGFLVTWDNVPIDRRPSVDSFMFPNEPYVPPVKIELGAPDDTEGGTVD